MATVAELKERVIKAQRRKSKEIEKVEKKVKCGERRLDVELYRLNQRDADLGTGLRIIEEFGER